MRRLLLPVALVALALTLSTLAQDQSARRSAREGPAAQPPPPGPEMGTKLEWFLFRPGRVVVRDTWEAGEIECRPWGDNDAGKAWLRVNVVVAYEDAKAAEKEAGLELVLSDEVERRTFFFDKEQIPDVLAGLDGIGAASEKLREPPHGARRRAYFSINGLEFGMSPRRTGGYLAPIGPDEMSVGLSPDNFAEIRRVLEEAQAIITRETARETAKEADRDAEPDINTPAR